MAKYTSTLAPLKVKPEQHESLKLLADREQSSIGRILRLAIDEYLAKHGFAQKPEITSDQT